MRIGSRQLACPMRTALLISACAALFAMTSGMLLAIHILSTDHSATDHDSHDCAICQQLLALSKKVLASPEVELTLETPAFSENVPAIAEHVETRCPLTSQSRGPPLSTHPL